MMDRNLHLSVQPAAESCNLSPPKTERQEFYQIKTLAAGRVEKAETTGTRRSDIFFFLITLIKRRNTLKEERQSYV